MIDIHSHLLPSIDDGAATIKQSLELARYAVADGITHMVVTPHIQIGTYDNSLTTISAAFEVFVGGLEEAGIELNVAMAAEIRLCPEILSVLEQGNLPLFVGPEGKQTLLLELPHSHVPPGTEQALKYLLAQDIGVVIAHPERNKEIILDCNKLEAFIDLGCMLQLTSGSVCGRFGKPPRMAAKHILQQGWGGLLASDAHNLQYRPPQLSDGRREAAAIIGEDRAHELVFETPWKLVGGMFGSSIC